MGQTNYSAAKAGVAAMTVTWAKELARYARDHADHSPAISQSADELVDIVYKPVRNYLEHCAYTTADDINPEYIKPNGMMYRMMKAGHE